MNRMLSHLGISAALLIGSSPALLAQQAAPTLGSNGIQTVLLIGIDSMHAIDFVNCARGVGGPTSSPSCPYLRSREWP